MKFESPKNEQQETKNEKFKKVKETMRAIINKDLSLDNFSIGERKLIDDIRIQYKNQVHKNNKFKPEFKKNEDKKVLTGIIKKINNSDSKNIENVDLKEKDKSAEEIQEVIEYRDKQDRTERYCEYITGMKLDDPMLPDRLIEDQKIIRAKYGLPKREIIFENPSEYESVLRERAKKIGVEIRNKDELNEFFNKYHQAAGVSLGSEKIIGIGIEKSSLRDYQRSIGILEHEMIHALQKRHYPGKNCELREYEAYLANINTEVIKKHGARTFFELFPLASTRADYKIASDEKNKIKKLE